MREAAQLLREKGLKVTPQRIAIYNMLAHTKEHPSAETIYRALEPSNPTMSLATVYKTLDSFAKVGLVQELSVGDGCSHYDAFTHSHPHIICTSCGKVMDLEVESLSHLKDAVAPYTDFHIESEKLFFYGTCPQCQQAKEKAM